MKDKVNLEDKSLLLTDKSGKMNTTMDIKLWKPLITKKQSIVFDVFGYRDNESYRPILIWEDKKANQFYYVIAKPINVNQDIEIIPDEFGSEVLVRYTLENGIINNYVIDCSQLLRIDRAILEDIIDVNANETISPINPYYVERISTAIHNCLLASPPYISLLSVSYDEVEKTINTYSVFINDLILDFFNVDSSGYEIVDRNIYRSAPSIESQYWNQRYENGIDFCRYFLTNFYNESNLTDFNEKEKERYKMLIIKEKASNIIKDQELDEIKAAIPTQVLDPIAETNNETKSNSESTNSLNSSTIDCEPKEQCLVSEVKAQ